MGALSPLSYILVLTSLDRGAPLSLVAPAREMSMMVGATFGMVLLPEKVNVWRLAGRSFRIFVSERERRTQRASGLPISRPAPRACEHGRSAYPHAHVRATFSADA